MKKLFSASGDQVKKLIAFKKFDETISFELLFLDKKLSSGNESVQLVTHRTTEKVSSDNALFLFFSEPKSPFLLPLFDSNIFFPFSFLGPPKASAKHLMPQLFAESRRDMTEVEIGGEDFQLENKFLHL